MDSSNRDVHGFMAQNPKAPLSNMAWEKFQIQEKKKKK